MKTGFKNLKSIIFLRSGPTVTTCDQTVCMFKFALVAKAIVNVVKS